ncbi:MAG: hypothetical protein IJC54_03340 [Clostridia bacterium]|nr:hypothetical protein [Clostridia bacterium]
MKKLLSVFLCMVAVFSCSAAFAEPAEPFDYTGAWSLITADVDGRSLSGVEAGIPDWTATLEPDGTARIRSVMKNMDETAAWQAVEGGVSIGDTVYALNASGALVSQENEGKRVTLARHSTLCGTWSLAFAKQGDQTMPLSALKQDMTIILREGGSAVVRVFGQTLSATWSGDEGSCTIDADGKPIAFTFADGLLFAEDRGAALYFRRTPDVQANVPADAFTGRWDLIDAYDLDTPYTEEALKEALTFVLDASGEVSRKSNSEKGYAANRLTWSIQEVEGLGTVCTIREHYGDSGQYDDYEVYLLENGLLKLWNKEARYQLYKKVSE